MDYTDILGKLNSIVYVNTDLVIVNFTGEFNGCSPFKPNTFANISIRFVRDYNKKIKLDKDIIGFARYDYEYTYNELKNKLEQSSKEKILNINIYEDLETFDLFSKILKDNSEISVPVKDSIHRKDDLDFIERNYQNLTSTGIIDYKDISEPFLEITSYMNHSEDLENVKDKYFPVKWYRVFTKYNSSK